jgi:hypothetical protein
MDGPNVNAVTYVGIDTGRRQFVRKTAQRQAPERVKLMLPVMSQA